MGTVRHVKEQKIKEFEEDLIHKNKKLQELDEMKSSFLSMVSHELRTPLTTIQGYITFLESEKTGNLNETQREFLKISEEEVEHLNHLIEELLDLSRIEKGEFKVNLEQVDMKAIVTKVMISLRSFALERQVTLEDSIPKDLPLVWADREKILQVVINLLENAIKFNKHGGGVTLSYMDNAGDNRIIFCVSDSGIGIEEDKLDKIFDRFYQIEHLGNRKYQGCGLGLAITKSILDLHKGRIWVESKIDLGSKFFFELQRYDKSE